MGDKQNSLHYHGLELIGTALLNKDLEHYKGDRKNLYLRLVDLQQRPLMYCQLKRETEC